MEAGLQMAYPRRWLVALALTAAAILLLALRVKTALTLAMNSDEPQHLHVVWAWTQGLLPYRDVFDNHAPLFGWLCAPLLAWLGERADIVALMRLAMIPLYFAALALTWWIGRLIWSSRTGLAAVALLALAPPFFGVTAQFRPDDLWMLLWLGAVAAVLTRPFGVRQAFVAGLLLGAAFAVSLKTLLLLLTAVLAATTLWAIRRLAGARRMPVRPAALLAALAGALLVPGAFAAYLFAEGAARDALYCLFTHNVVPGLGHWGTASGWHRLVFPLGYAGATLLAWRARHAGEPDVAWRRRWLLLSLCAYLFALYSYWPLFTRQDVLPVLPLLALALAAWLTRVPAPPRALRYAVVAFLAGLVTVHQAQLAWMGDALRVPAQRLATVLALTRPGEPVMDAKGEAIFRSRPLYWVLEGVTQRRMAIGLIPDDIAERLAATATPLVIGDRLPPRDAAFVAANYLPIGQKLWLLGQRLGTLRAGERVRFEIAVPATYSAVTARGSAAGTLDDGAAATARALDAGSHSFTAAADGAVALVWTPALARGLHTELLFAGTDPR
ncbi:MAG: hypothetical protein GXC76_12655 [Rhodanobacteraceae bacterium]|jgi:hypothetical protein|nr:hypothetical protein [Rhodanobacteraceae bacterium]